MTSATRFWACAGKDNRPSNRRTVTVRSIIASLPEPVGRALSRLRLTDFQSGKCLAAVGTNAAAEINGDSARPLGNSRLSYRSLKPMRRGSTVARSEMVLLHCMSPELAGGEVSRARWKVRFQGAKRTHFAHVELFSL